MDHKDHVNLLRKGISEKNGTWADFGSGTGAFTLALADLIAPSAEIYSVDKNRRALLKQERAMQSRFPERQPHHTHYIVADFTEPINLPPIDGLVMANALHFTRQKDEVLQLIYTYLKPSGRFILVEYNIDRGNTWVPYPISYPRWETLASRSGFVQIQLLATRRGTFREIYSVLNIKPPPRSTNEISN